MPRVLVVEDSPTQAAELVFILRDAGLEAESEPDAESGFARLAGERFDVVLTDLHLPGEDGLEFCRRIRAHATTRHLPVVVCTAQDDAEDVLRGLECGADGFLNKRRAPHEVVGCLHRVLARPRPSAPAERSRVEFLGRTYEIDACRDTLLDVLACAFEDLVHLNRQSHADEAALRALNRTLAERNRQLQELADSERRAHEERKRAETQLVQAEKLGALGRMVAGVAHEMNNPLAFVINNLAVLRRDMGVMHETLLAYQSFADAPEAERGPILDRLRERAESLDLSYTLDHLDELMNRTDEGLRRIQKIVRNLRDFVRLDESEQKEADLNAGITATLDVVRAQAHDRHVELADDLAPLPGVICYPAKINQVVLNLLVNAIDACQPGDRVTVATRLGEGPGVEIEVSDTGSGIDPAIRDKIFEPFFTTKAPGKGTGLGLSISYGIVASHGGRIDVESNGRGSRFLVSLPLRSGAAAASQPLRPISSH